ncbi:MAG: alpha/beta hydrolase fold domain-containing protein [Planctomycetes bacterium]|nr:alpha/beta hydrolase fold domain-containing protein [Planctomycetota bacterium]
MKRWMLLLIAIAAVCALRAPLVAQEKPAEKPAVEERNPKAEWPNEQPKTGPGSSEYAHKSTTVENRGKDGTEYWVYQPAEPKAEKAPVVVFLHGFGAMLPTNYICWVEHICKRGNIVIYPRYQADFLEPLENFPTNSATSVLDALSWLEADKARTQPVKDKFALVGHSAGAATAANVASRYEELKLPKPLALMPVMPGAALNYDEQIAPLAPLGDFSKIPKGCLLACCYADSDEVVGDYLSRQIFIEATSVAAADKNLIEFRTDLYGARPLVATHSTPGAPAGSADVFDWCGYWKIFDGLSDAAFHGKNREYALGDTEKQRSLGKFSDGRAVKELKVTLGDAKCELKNDYCPLCDREGGKFDKDKPRRTWFPRKPKKPADPPADPPKAPPPPEEKPGRKSE